MTTPAPVAIARSLVSVLEAALEPYEIQVERDRPTAVTLEETPRVLVYTDGTGVETDFIGGAQLRMAMFGVEVLDAPASDEQNGDITDRVATLREIVRTALMSNRTLSGACLGLFVEVTGEGRTDISATRIRLEALRVSCYFVSP